jgi:hypothetical protein
MDKRKIHSYKEVREAMCQSKNGITWEEFLKQNETNAKAVATFLMLVAIKYGGLKILRSQYKTTNEAISIIERRGHEEYFEGAQQDLEAIEEMIDNLEAEIGL